MGWLSGLDACKRALAACIVAGLQGFTRKQSPEPDSSAGHAKSRARTLLCTRFNKRRAYTLPAAGSHYGQVGGQTGRTRYSKQGGRNLDSPPEQDPHCAWQDGVEAQCRRARRRENLVGMVWHDFTTACVVRGPGLASEDDERFSFSGWLVYRRYAIKSADGGSHHGRRPVRHGRRPVRGGR